MKKMLLLAGVLALAACGEKKAEAPAGETTGEMAPAATMDSGMTHSDTAMARDTAAAK
jgi:predicted small lipoprotein YifL